MTVKLDYLDTDVAYFLGLLVGRGIIAPKTASSGNHEGPADDTIPMREGPEELPT